jgi:hypothetical protein
VRKKPSLQLSHSTRKALCVQLGESAGTEIANVLQMLAERIEQLERTKVNVTPVVPANSAKVLATIADQFS